MPEYRGYAKIGSVAAGEPPWKGGWPWSNAGNIVGEPNGRMASTLIGANRPSVGLVGSRFDLGIPKLYSIDGIKVLWHIQTDSPRVMARADLCRAGRWSRVGRTEDLYGLPLVQDYQFGIAEGDLWGGPWTAVDANQISAALCVVDAGQDVAVHVDAVELVVYTTVRTVTPVGSGML